MRAYKVEETYIGRGMSHDDRVLMKVINGNAELLSDLRNIVDDQREAIKDLQKSVSTLQDNLIEALKAQLNIKMMKK